MPRKIRPLFYYAGEPGGGSGSPSGKPEDDPGGSPEPSVEDLQKELDDTKTQLSAARSDAYKYRNQAKEISGKYDTLTNTLKEKGIDMDSISAFADLKKEVDALSTQLKAANSASVVAQLEAAATRAGFHDPTAVSKFVDFDKLDVNEGKVTDADKIVKRVAEDAPYLIKSNANSDAGKGGQNIQPAGEDMNAIIRQAAGVQT